MQLKDKLKNVSKENVLIKVCKDCNNGTYSCVVIRFITGTMFVTIIVTISVPNIAV